MNNWIDRLERRYSRFAIPYLVNGLMVGQLAAGLIVLLINWQFSGFISLSRSAVLHGRIWRLITFLFQPVWLGGALGIALGYAVSMAANKVLPMFMSDTAITVSPSFNSIVVAFGISVGIGVLFGYLPARRAARLNPIEALRYD